MRRAGSSPDPRRSTRGPRRALPVVVVHAAVLDRAVVVQERVGGAVVAVERHADAARVDQLDPARPGPRRNGEVRVAEHDPRRRSTPISRSASASGGSGVEAAHVGQRRARGSRARRRRGCRLGQRGELLRQLRRRAARAQRAISGLHRRRARPSRRRVQRSTLPRIHSRVELRSRSTVSRGQAPNERVVAAEQEPSLRPPASSSTASSAGRLPCTS